MENTGNNGKRTIWLRNDKIQEGKWCAGVPSRWNFGARAVAWVGLMGRHSGVRIVEAAFLSGFLPRLV